MRGTSFASLEEQVSKDLALRQVEMLDAASESAADDAPSPLPRWMSSTNTSFRTKTSSSWGFFGGPRVMIKNRQLSSAVVDEILARADNDERPRLGPKRSALPDSPGVFDPRSRWRLRFDSLVLCAVCYEAIALPYELCFVESPSVASTIVSLGIALIFFFDLVATANTAVFDAVADAWVLKRLAILRIYVSSPWFLTDVAACVPWRLLRPAPQWLELVRLAKFGKLGSVAASWRSGLREYLRYKDEIVAKYVLGLVFLIHYEACGLRLVDRAIDEDEVFVKAHAVERFGSERKPKPWAEYVLCVEWALGCFFGEAHYYNAAEGALTVANQMFGLIVVSVLVADLTNTLCHLDPARNAYRATSDCLTDFLRRSRVPPAALESVRDYLRSAEPVFRLKFNFRLIASLSPQLQVAVSHWLLGTQCARLPFVAYCKQRALGLAPHRVIYVEPSNRRNDLRPARILRLNRSQRYDIQYLDGDLEYDVAHTRLALERLPPELRRRGLEVDAECRSFVTSLAERLGTQQYMRGDVIIVRNFSVTDALYLVERGDVTLVGRDMSRPFSVEHRTDKQTFGEDIALLALESRRRRLRWYSAKARDVSQIHSIQAEAFVAVLQMPAHRTLLAHIRGFGCWLALKLRFLECHRAGTLHELFRAKSTSRERRLNQNRDDDLADARRRIAELADVLGRLECRTVPDDHVPSSRMDEEDSTTSRSCDPCAVEAGEAYPVYTPAARWRHPHHNNRQ